MAIKIEISDKIKFKVAGTLNTETTIGEDFEFTLVGNNYDTQTLADRLSDKEETKEAFLLKEISAWSSVKDKDGVDVPFSRGAFERLLKTVGLTDLVFHTYLSEVGVKAKN
jgi:hypothetical protein